MCAKRVLSLLVAASFAALIAGCGKTPDCGDLDKITDPDQKAELLNKCGRGGPAFQPSKEKKW